MNRYSAFLMKWILFITLLIISGCSTYHQTASSSFPQPNLNQLTSQTVHVKQGEMEYYRFGHGSPIVLIPGYATDISSWNKAFLLALAKQHQLILLNNRNVGRSIIHSRDYATIDLANDTYQLIQELHLNKPAVLGISMGGMIAQQLAATHSKQLGQLILINTAICGKQAVHPSPDVENKMLNMPTTKLGRYFIAIELFVPPQAKMKMAIDLATDRFLPQDYKEIDPAAVMPQQRYLIQNWISDNATTNKLQKLHLPVLILNGKSDIVIPPINSVILARNIPHAQLNRWEEGGHAMTYQYPKQLADTIDHFISQTQ